MQSARRVVVAHAQAVSQHTAGNGIARTNAVGTCVAAAGGCYHVGDEEPTEDNMISTRSTGIPTVCACRAASSRSTPVRKKRRVVWKG